MHSENHYLERYDLKKYSKMNSRLDKHMVWSPSGQQTINFNDSNAVYELNKAMLLVDYKLKDYNLPKGYLLLPIPGRIDYLLNLRDFLSAKFNFDKGAELRGLDIDAGANSIYCILGTTF